MPHRTTLEPKGKSYCDPDSILKIGPLAAEW